ncbi:MAG: class I tRNA ligase family protein, partial [Thermoplasmata archaeon]|nr:class I tRNA ligase family protein [Thermoplasmata archaeon]
MAKFNYSQGIFCQLPIHGISMPFKTYSTESGKIEEFEPLTPGEVKMYICGPTVYNLIHIGHARSYILFDILRRWLEYSGYKVTHVQNFSDVEESIARKGIKMGMTPQEVGEFYIKEFFVDTEGLNLKRAHSYPTYSQNVPVMIRIVQDLLDSGVAYESGGDVYFRTKEGSGFGRLSHVNLKETVVDGLDLPEGRENPFDFVL